MRRVVVLGRGAAGKSTLARQLGDLTGLPVTELDAIFWQPGLTPAEPAGWAARQRERAEYWRWVLAYRRRYLPRIRTAVAASAPGADLFVLRSRSSPRGRWQQRMTVIITHPELGHSTSNCWSAGLLWPIFLAWGEVDELDGGRACRDGGGELAVIDVPGAEGTRSPGGMPDTGGWWLP